MSSPIEIKGFKKRYRKTMVEIPSLRLEGRLIVLLGANGSGKTTLLKAMAGLLRYEGRITNTEQAIYVGTDTHIPSTFTVEEYCRFLATMTKDAPESLLRKLVRVFSLEGEMKKSLGELSQGNRQKVNLVQGLSAKKGPHLIDEPFSGLDKAARRALIDHLAQRTGRIIVATHELSFLARVPSRRYRL